MSSHLVHDLLEIHSRHARTHGGVLEIILLLNGSYSTHVLLGNISIDLLCHSLEEGAPRQSESRVIKPDFWTLDVSQLSSFLKRYLTSKTFRSFE